MSSLYNQMKRVHSRGKSASSKKLKKIRLGICAMDKKTKSKPMREILSRLSEEFFEVIIFGDECILNAPIEEWPQVEVLIAFYSNHYPTEKALEYVKLRKPYMVNDLEGETTLKDRRRVYELLQTNGIDVPRHVYCERDQKDDPSYDPPVVEEFDEYILVNGAQINKPLVEKPVDAEDHNIYIYYPMSAGGGSKRLFRKVDDRSSEFYPRINELRTEGSYIYEEFIVTQGTDVKVYTVGPDYGHAEARKSPVVDGRVNRDSMGLEVRYPVILSPAEKEMARKIVIAFKQTVCGFDILRVHGRSFCCDVNGFSFVKNSRKYYDDASQVLTEIMLTATRPEYKPTLSTRAPLLRTVNLTKDRLAALTRKREQLAAAAAAASGGGGGGGEGTDGENSSEYARGGSQRGVAVGEGDSPHDSEGDSGAEDRASPSAHELKEFKGTLSRRNSTDMLEKSSNLGGDQEELRCVIAVVRHGDRTPKQKMKVKVSHPKYLDYFHTYAKSPKKDLKVKSKSALVRFLEITREIIAEGTVGPEQDLFRKLRQIKDVLERWEISGINRKLQMKPQRWEGEDGPSRSPSRIPSRNGTPSLEEAFAGSGGGKESKPASTNPVIQLATASAANAAAASTKTAVAAVEGGNGDVGLSADMTKASIAEDMPPPPPPTKATAATTTTTISSDASRANSEGDLVLLRSAESGDFGSGSNISSAASTGAGSAGSDDKSIESDSTGPRKPQKKMGASGGFGGGGGSSGNDLLESKKDKEEKSSAKATEVLLILKWGGDLTPLGREQAELMGARFRHQMYPDNAGGGVLRLHATYRHDLKIKASDEGRVMKTAAAFAKGLLELEGQLTPILASLVTVEDKNRQMLDRGGNVQIKEDMDRCKEHLNLLQKDVIMTDELVEEIAAGCPTAVKRSLLSLQNPQKTLRRLHMLISQICSQLHAVCDSLAVDYSADPFFIDHSMHEDEKHSPEKQPTRMPPSSDKLYLSETFSLMLDRWEKLNKDFFSTKTGIYDLTKVPDIYDMVRYDVLHNSHIEFEGLEELYRLASSLENSIVPQEYGMDNEDKRCIGSKVCGALLEKIKYDLIVSKSDTVIDMRYQLNPEHSDDLEIHSLGRAVRTRLYFTSESHLHTLLNVLRFPSDGEACCLSPEGLAILDEVSELSYLTQVVFRLFEDREDPSKFRCEISFSPGATQNPFFDKTSSLAPTVVINKDISCDELIACLSNGIAVGKENNGTPVDLTATAAEAAAHLDMSLNDIEAMVNEGVGIHDGRNEPSPPLGNPDSPHPHTHTHMAIASPRHTTTAATTKTRITVSPAKLSRSSSATTTVVVSKQLEDKWEKEA